MKRTVIAVLAFAAFFVLNVAGQKTSSLEAQLGAIIHQAEGEGKYEAAIPRYKQFIKDHSKDSPLAANAEYHLGRAYEKLSNPDDARKVYDQLVHDYPNEIVADAAKQRLTAMAVSSSLQLVPISSSSDEFNFNQSAIDADGRLAAYRDNGGVSLRNLETGKTTTLVKFNADAKPDALDKGSVYPGQFAFSPDSRLTAYGWTVDGNQIQLRIISNEANAKPKILFDNSEYVEITPKAWTRDGRILVVTLLKSDRTWGLAWVSVSDGTMKPIKSLGWRFPTVAGGPSLSPDGGSIAYAALPSNPSAFGAGQLNGPRLPGDTTDRHIYVIPANGSGPEIEVVNDGNLNLFPTWMPDGKSLLFVSNRMGNYGIWSVAVPDASLSRGPVHVTDSGDIRVIGMTRSGSLYYTKYGKDYPEITIANIEGSNGSPGVRLPEKTIAGEGAAWSPDGKHIAAIKTLTGIGSGGGPVLMVYSLDGGAERPYFAPGSTPNGIQLVPRNGYPLWSHDGNGIFLLGRDNVDDVSLYRVDLKTSEFKKILPQFNQDGVLSPDDKTLYVIAKGVAPTPSTAPSTDRVDRIMAINLNSRLQKQVSDTIGAEFNTALLSPDGQTLYLKTACDLYCRSIAALDSATGKQKQILTVQDPDRLPTGCKMALSADGHNLAVIVNQDQGYRLVRIGVDGSNQRTIYNVATRIQMPAWTLDGAEIMAATPSAHQVVRIPANGGSSQIVRTTKDFDVSSFSFSPDSLRIAINGKGSTPDEFWRLDNVASFLKTAR